MWVDKMEQGEGEEDPLWTEYNHNKVRRVTENRKTDAQAMQYGLYEQHGIMAAITTINWVAFMMMEWNSRLDTLCMRSSEFDATKLMQLCVVYGLGAFTEKIYLRSEITRICLFANHQTDNPNRLALINAK